MQSLLLQAKGNVLFIDEAYTLCDNSDDKKDFGNRAIESLLTVLAQKNNDMIVIFAGYEKEMEKMMAINPGLKGRFPYRYKFDDYSVDELITIAQHILDKENYILSEDANVALRKCIIDETKSKDAYFSNARWIEQIIKNGIIPTMANRIVEMKLMDANDKDLFQIIHVNDVEMAYKKYSNGNNSKYNRMNPIGFRL